MSLGVESTSSIFFLSLEMIDFFPILLRSSTLCGQERVSQDSQLDQLPGQADLVVCSEKSKEGEAPILLSDRSVAPRCPSSILKL